MWETPIYKVKAKIEDREKEILIDVTGSAPNFDEPGKQLEGTFESLLRGLDPLKTKILDFGAAKLRNTIYLLDKGYAVYACEYKDLFERSQQAKEFYETCKGYKNFKTLVFPDDFIDFEDKFDVILLINVLNVMPIPYERLCVLALCHKKMKSNGRLLWYTQHGAYSEANAVGKLYDGLVTGKGRKYNMFYRDFSKKEINDLLKSTGFSFNKDFKFPTSGTNQAYVFSPTGEILVDKTLGLTEMLRKKPTRKLKEIIRESRWKVENDETETKKVVYTASIPRLTKPIEINILEQYAEELKKLSSGGGKKATKYHQLIINILSEVFSHCLKNLKKEKEINQGRKRVDITFDNKHEEGFFKELHERYNVHCPIIFFECKNYTNALENPEYDQIEGRLNKRRGMFGVITCRKIKNLSSVDTHCRDLVRENPGSEKYVIVLDDEDINKLIKFKLEVNQQEISNLLDQKFQKLIL